MTTKNKIKHWAAGALIVGAPLAGGAVSRTPVSSSQPGRRYVVAEHRNESPAVARREETKASSPFDAFGGATSDARRHEHAAVDQNVAKALRFLRDNDLLKPEGSAQSQLSGDIDLASGRKAFAHDSVYSHCHAASGTWNTHDWPTSNATQCQTKYGGTWHTKVTAPLFQSASVTAKTATSFDIFVDLNQASTLYAVLVDTSSTPPTSAQVKAGTDGSGTAAVQTKSLALSTGDFSGTVSFTGLDSSKKYMVYLVGENGSGEITPTPEQLNPAYESAVVYSTTDYYVYPKVKESSAGNLYLFYSETHTDSFVVKKWNGSSWANHASFTKNDISPVPYALTWGGFNRVDFDVDASENIHVVFSIGPDNWAKNQDPWHAKFNGSTWTFTQANDDIDGPDEYQLHVDHGDKVHIAYDVDGYNVGQNYYSLRYLTNVSGSWARQTVMTTADRSHEIGEKFVVRESTGKVHIIYAAEDDPWTMGYYMASSADNFAAKTHILNALGDGTVYDVGNVVIDGNDKIHYVYTDRGAGRAYYRTNASGSWVTTEITRAGHSNLSAYDLRVVNSTVYIVMYSSAGFFIQAYDGSSWHDGFTFELDGWFNEFAIDSTTSRVMLVSEDSSNPYRVIYHTGSLDDYVLVGASNNAPAFTSSSSFLVSETATSDGTVLLDVQANDGDGGSSDANVTYSITGGTGSSLFSIDADDGQLRLNATGASTLDYELVTSYTLTIRADDGGASNNTTEQTITVGISNAAPVVTSGQSFNVNESASNGAVVGTVAVTGDQDSISFSIASGNTDGAFAIDAGGKISVIDRSKLDASTTSAYSLGISAGDGSTTGTQTVTVNVVDDVSPTVTTAPGVFAPTATTVEYTVSFNENVVGVSADDFSLARTGSALGTITSVSGSGASYVVTVSSVSGEGSLRLDVNGSTNIQDAAGNLVGAYSSGAVHNVDRQSPTVTDANLSISGGTGTSGAFKIGDTVTASWDNSAGGDNNSDVVSSVSVDFSAFGGGASAAATNVGGIWTASYTLVAGAIDTVNRNVAITATDDAGNTTTIADSSNAVVDTVAPTLNDSAISISGGSGTGGVYIIGDTVTASWDDTSAGDNNSDSISVVTADFSAFGGGAAVAAYNAGNIWTASYTVTNGSLDVANANLSMTVVDNAGNGATAADTSNASVDNVNPVLTDANISLSGASGVGGSFVSGDTVTLTWNDTATGDNNTDTISSLEVDFSAFGGGTAVAAINDSDTWRATHTIAEGSVNGSNLNVTATATDNAGNMTVTADSSNVAVDSASPSVASVAVPAAEYYSAGETMSFTVNVSEAVIVDTAGGTPRLPLSVGAATRYAGYVSGSGSTALVFSYTVQAGDEDSDGVLLGSALETNGGSVQDAAGNGLVLALNAVASTSGVLVDAVVPVAPARPDLIAVSDSGQSDSDNLTSVATPTFSGTAEANSTVTVSTQSGDLGSTSADASGNWAFTPGTSLADGSHSITAASTDAAGNKSSSSLALVVTVDTSAPAAPSVPDLTAASDSGSSDVDNITNDHTPTFTGTAEANSTVAVFTDLAGQLGTTTADGSGQWSFTSGVLPDGTHQLSVRATDGAGNESAISGSLSVVIDSAAPAVPAIPDLIAASDTGSSDGDNITRELMPTLTGTADPNTVVVISSDIDGTLGSVSPDASGNWSFTAGSALTANVNHALSVTSVDTAANETTSGTLSIVLDTQAPTLASSMPADNSTSVSKDSGLTFTFSEDVIAGSAGDNAVSVYNLADGTLIESLAADSAQVSVTGGVMQLDWSQSFTPSYSYYVQVGADVATDVAGNAYAGISDTSSLDFTVANASPVAADDSVALNEDQVVSTAVLANDTDADSSLNPASLRITTAAAKGTVSIDSGTGVITYTPAENFNGADTFAYVVSDSYGASSNAATVNIVVAPMNDAPVASADLAMTPAGTAVTVDVAANDSDLDVGDGVDAATVRLVRMPGHGSVQVDAGGLRYQPEAGFTGSDEFTYAIKDQHGAESAPGLVIVNVTDGNNLPAANDDSVAATEDTDSIIDVLANDEDLDGTLAPNTLKIVRGPANGDVAVDSASGSVTYTPAADFAGSDSFEYLVRDDAGGSSNIAIVSITVDAVNDAPVANADGVHVTTADPVIVNVIGNDYDVENGMVPGSVEVITAPAAGSATADGATGLITYTPLSFGGSDSFTYRVQDSDGSWSAPAIVTLSNQPFNHPPVANSDMVETSEDLAVVIAVLDNDSDVDGSIVAGSVVFSEIPVSGTAQVNADGSITYEPHADFSGDDSFSYIVSDNSSAQSNLATVTIRVTAVDDLPTITGTPDTSVVAGFPYAFVPVLDDSDGDGLTVSIQNQPVWSSFDPATGALTGTPSNANAGVNSKIVLTLHDGSNAVDLPAFSIEVLADTDGDGMANVADTDDDGDGMPDSVEVDNGFDPVDSRDALLDADNDGVINVDEYILGTDPLRDDYAPEFSALEDIVIDAEGLLTLLPELAIPSAIDGRDGVLEATLATTQTRFAPGEHVLTWVALDAAGNRAEASQSLLVMPIISMNRDQTVSEGSEAVVRILLNGESPVYPLTVAYALSGTADESDYDIPIGAVTFDAGELEQQVVLSIKEDDTTEGTEVIEFALQEAGTTVGAANFGAKRNHRVEVVEENLPPSVDLSLAQNGRSVRIVAQDQGPVTVTANVTDPNPGDTHSLTWQLPGVAAGGAGMESRTFDPAELVTGVHEISVTVEENNSAPLSASATVTLKVVATAPRLRSGRDSDRDGRSDLDEGTQDSDGDGQPNYLDTSPLRNVLDEDVTNGASFMIEGEAGVQMGLGRWALQSGGDGAQIGDDVVGVSTGFPADNLPNVGGYFDFEIAKIPSPGSWVSVVLPQVSPVPGNPVYRKFANGVWFTFIENGQNRLSSTLGDKGFCPPPGSPEYQPGLTPGHWCVQLTIQDGGPNDADGTANSVISDPGGVADAAAAVHRTRNGGGGAFGLPALAALLLFGLLRLRRSRHAVAMLGVLLFIPFNAGAQENDWWRAVYVTSGAAWATSPISKGDVSREFLDKGINARVRSVDTNRLAWELGFGIDIAPRWSVEAAYRDLGDVETEFNLTAGANDVASVRPASGEGMNISAVYRHPLMDRVELTGRLGAFFWEEDYETLRIGERIDRDSESGVDLNWGLGASYFLNPQVTVTSEVQGVEFDMERTFLVGFGVRFSLR